MPVVRAPVEKAGFTPQPNTLYKYFNAETPQEQELAGSDNPMTVINGEVQVSSGNVSSELIERFAKERDIQSMMALPVAGAAWYLIVAGMMGAPIAAGVVGGTAVVFGVSYLISDSDTQVSNLDKFKKEQEQRWKDWEKKNGISRADIFQYAVTDYQIAQLAKTGGYTLAKDWADGSPISVTEEDLRFIEAELQEKMENATTPPDYISPTLLDKMRRNAYKLGIIPLSLFVLFVLWRRRKKRRRK